MLRAKSGNWNGTIELACIVSGKGTYAVAQPLAFTNQDEGEEVRPFFALDHDEAQVLMDDLWRCGIRPTEGAGSAGALAATQAHLKDLQQLMVWAYDPKNGPWVMQQGESEDG